MPGRDLFSTYWIMDLWPAYIPWTTAKSLETGIYASQCRLYLRTEACHQTFSLGSMCPSS